MFALLAVVSAIAPVLHFCGAQVRTQFSIPQPQFTAEAAWSGAYTQSLEQWLRESTPLTYHLRGLYTESRYLAGILDSDTVLIGKDGMMTSRAVLDIGWNLFQQLRQSRRDHLVAIRDRARRLGVTLGVAIAPDTPTLYGDAFSPRTARVRAQLQERQICYDAIQKELAELEIATVDLKSPLLAARKAGLLVCHLADTHWTDVGAKAAADAVVAQLEASPLMASLGTPATFDFTRMVVLSPGDLVRAMGLRADFRGQRSMATVDNVWLAELPTPLLGNLYEGWAIYSVGREADYETRMRSAGLALCGDSYSNRSFKWHLATRLHRLVDWTYAIEDAKPLATIGKCLDDIEQGTCKAKVVIWEVVERKFIAEL